jgi:protein-tyrosine phosphatase
MASILLVCRCNVCRSPMACAVANQLLARSALVRQLQISAAGTHANLRGSRPDPRALATLERHGYTPQRTRARAIAPKDFVRFDQILAMDQSNLDDLQRLCPPAHAHKLGLYLALASDAPFSEIPDPYFGSPQSFERVLELCETAALGLLTHWRSQLGAQPT